MKLLTISSAVLLIFISFCSYSQIYLGMNKKDIAKNIKQYYSEYSSTLKRKESKVINILSYCDVTTEVKIIYYFNEKENCNRIKHVYPNDEYLSIVSFYNNNFTVTDTHFWTKHLGMYTMCYYLDTVGSENDVFSVWTFCVHRDFNFGDYKDLEFDLK